MKLVNRSAPLAKVGLKNAKPYAITGVGPVWLYGYSLRAGGKATLADRAPCAAKLLHSLENPTPLLAWGFLSTITEETLICLFI